MAKRLLPRNPPRRVPPPVRETGIFDMEPQLTEKERRIAHRPPISNERGREHEKPSEEEQPMKWEDFPLKEHLMPLMPLKKGQLGELPPLTTHEPFVPPKLPKRDSMLRVENISHKKKKGKK